jgi:hypothetical protein
MAENDEKINIYLKRTTTAAFATAGIIFCFMSISDIMRSLSFFNTKTALAKFAKLALIG